MRPSPKNPDHVVTKNMLGDWGKMGCGGWVGFYGVGW